MLKDIYQVLSKRIEDKRDELRESGLGQDPSIFSGPLTAQPYHPFHAEIAREESGRDQQVYRGI
ncbi:MAG: hypothetical protein ACI86P_002464 [Flavobacteriales bacterium]|jgi:hypothetical protein